MYNCRYFVAVIIFVLASFAGMTRCTKDDKIEHGHSEIDGVAEGKSGANIHIVKLKQQQQLGAILPTLYQEKIAEKGKLGNKTKRKCSMKTTIKQSDIQGRRVKRSVVNPNKESLKEDICLLQVHQNTTETFYSRVLYDKVDALSLIFKFAEDIKVSSVPGLILPFKWRWVYQETLSYLRMPYAAVVWSLGLLYVHNGEPLDVYLYYPDNMPESCYNLVIGDITSDVIIGKALGRMTKVITQNNHRYNSSHWCYMQIIKDTNEGVISALDNNFFSTSPTLENCCCRYSFDSHTESVECANIYNYDALWWDAPLAIGLILLLYFPLAFLKVTGMLCTKASSLQLKDHNEAQENSTAQSEPKSGSRSGYVFLGKSSPITVTSLVASSCSSAASLSLSTKSRICIFIWTLFTLLVPGIELLSYYVFLYDYIVDLAKNDVSTGWSSMIIGWKSNRMKFNLFAGPFVTLGTYLILGWLILLVPKSLANQISKGVDYRSKRSAILLNIPLEKKEILGSVNVKKCTNGFTRLFKLQLCHTFMVINSAFWVFIIKEIKNKLASLHSKIRLFKITLILRYFSLLVCGPFCCVFSVIEVLYLTVFYTIPLLSFTYYTLRGLCIGLNKYLSKRVFCNHDRFGSIICVFACGMLALCFICHLYIFTILFVDGFFFFSRITMLTFTAFVAYPHETYGYFMLTVLSAYFVLEGLFRFGTIYRQILKYAIKFSKQDLSDEECKSHFTVYSHTSGALVYGISKPLFEYLVNHIRPRRVHFLCTSIKLIFIVFVLTISITLIDHFNRFQEISLFVHIFITIFICFLPRMYYHLIATRGSKQKLKSKVRELLRMWKSQPTTTVL